MKRMGESHSASSGECRIPELAKRHGEIAPWHQDDAPERAASLPRQCKRCHLLPAIEGGGGCHAFHNCGGRIGRRIASSTFRIDSIVDRPQ